VKHHPEENSTCHLVESLFRLKINQYRVQLSWQVDSSTMLKAIQDINHPLASSAARSRLNVIQ